MSLSFGKSDDYVCFYFSENDSDEDVDEEEVWEDNDSENDDDGLLPILEPY